MVYFLKAVIFLDAMADIRHVVMDKTGTMTAGVFKVQEIKLQAGYDEARILKLVNKIESHSSHPVATAIREYAGAIDESINLHNIEEIAGHGLKQLLKAKSCWWVTLNCWTNLM
jgi:Cd2+/Zn2+-exporting ATPase